MTRVVPRPANVIVGAGLVEAREARNLSLRNVAKRAKISPGALSYYEWGGSAPSVATAAMLLGILEAPVAVRNHLLDLVARAQERNFVACTERELHLLRTGYEQLAFRVCEWSPTLFPSALRTSTYAQALHESRLLSFDITPRSIIPGKRVRAPDDNQRGRAFRRETEPRRTFLIGEAATRPDACTSDVLRDQIEEVGMLQSLLDVSVDFVPASACAPGLVEPFTLYEDQQRAIAAAVPHRNGAIFFTDPETVKRYQKAAQHLRSSVVNHAWT
ncbi:Scr1 family TA system antitoxin-like transcriptional regulator [Amycolatopsis sp. cg9]|uniref:Scr1 family TA system antitoxin-like transcriptional regulator n=1 Tax=Amycolatopsis sp. cg9 TaxID=3238801 RepID=UPI0035265B1F